MIVDLITIKQHLNITDDADNVLLQQKIDTAEQWISKFIGHWLLDEVAFPGGTPEPINEAVMQLVGHLYENREATLVGVSAEALPFGIYDLLAPYREYVF